MGVQGLWDLLSPVGRPVSLESLQNKILAVDVSIWLNQAMKGCKDKQGYSSLNAHLLVVFNRICKLLFYKIKPVFIFDGTMPQLKKQTLLSRQEQRESAARKSKNYILKKYILEKLQNKKTDQIPLEKLNKEEISEDENIKIININSSDETSSDNDYENDRLVENFQNPSSIDFETEEFKELPLDMQHELLTNVKETYKRRYLVQKEDMPKKSCDFSDYQMMRLLHRRKIQKKLEEVEKTMNMRSTNILQEMHSSYMNLEGKTAEVNRVMSEDSSHFILLKQIDNNSKKEQTEDTTDKANHMKSENSPNLTPLKETDTNIYKEEMKETTVCHSQVNSEELENNFFKHINENIVEVLPVEKNCDNISKVENNNDFNILCKLPDQTIMNLHEKEAIAEQIAIMESLNKKEQINNSKIFSFSDYDSKSSNKDEIVMNSDLVVLNTSQNNENIVEIVNLNTSLESDTNKNDDIYIETSDSNETSEINTEIPQITHHIFKEVNSSDIQCEEVISKTSCKENQMISKQQPITVTVNLTNPPSTDEDLFPATIFENTSNNSISGTNISKEESNLPASDISLTIEDLKMNVKTLQAAKETQDRRTLTIAEHTYQETKELLTLFGIPYVNSPTEAEAQCAELDMLGLTDGTITDDSDIWLFGGQKVYKNFFAQKKYVEFFKATDIQSQFNLNRKKLIGLAMLTGCDYTHGIQTVGPITAMEILSEFPGDGIESLQKFRKWWEGFQYHKELPRNSTLMKLRRLELDDGFPSEIVNNAFLNPTVDHSTEKFSWGHPDLDQLREFAEEKFGWTMKKIDEILLPVMKKVNENQVQMKINNYFTVDLKKEENLFPSKRLHKAVKKLHSQETGNDLNDQPKIKLKKVYQRRITKKSKQKNSNNPSSSKARTYKTRTEKSINLSEESSSD